MLRKNSVERFIQSGASSSSGGSLITSTHPVWSSLQNRRYQDGIRSLSNISESRRDDSWYYARALCLQGLQDHLSVINLWQKRHKVLNKEESMCLARSFRALGRDLEAFGVLQKIDSRALDDGVILALARCCQILQWYDLALQYYKRLSKPIDAMTGEAECLREMQCYDGAIRLLQSMYRVNPDKNHLVNIARCLRGMHKHDLALLLYKSITDYMHYPNVLQGLAYCYKEMGRYKDALEAVELCLSIRYSRPVRRCRAGIYQSMGHFERAISLWADCDKTGLANCYLQMNLPEKALQVYDSIEQAYQTRAVQLGRSKCYQAMGRLDDAISVLNGIEFLEFDKAVLLQQFDCYNELGARDIAFSCLSKIPNAMQDKDVIIRYCRLDRILGNSHTALERLTALANWQNFPEVLLEQVKCYEHLRDNDTANTIYESSCERFPYSRELLYHYCQFKLKNAFPDAYAFLMQSIEKWPSANQFLKLKKQYFESESCDSRSVRQWNDARLSYKKSYDRCYYPCVNPRSAVFFAKKANLNEVRSLEALDLAAGPGWSGI